MLTVSQRNTHKKMEMLLKNKIKELKEIKVQKEMKRKKQEKTK